MLRAQDVDDLKGGGDTLVLSVSKHQLALLFIMNSPKAVDSLDTGIVSRQGITCVVTEGNNILWSNVELFQRMEEE